MCFEFSFLILHINFMLFISVLTLCQVNVEMWFSKKYLVALTRCSGTLSCINNVQECHQRNDILEYLIDVVICTKLTVDSHKRCFVFEIFTPQIITVPHPLLITNCLDLFILVSLSYISPFGMLIQFQMWLYL